MIELERISKAFSNRDGTTAPVLDEISLAVPNGRIAALYGPNGSGKTTLLNVIAKLESADAGRVSVEASSARPRLGYVLQDFAPGLLPWKSSLENVAFALKSQGMSPAMAKRQAMNFLDEQSFPFAKNHYPYEMSIGQQQMLALARVLIQQPANLLFDEAFSALDHETRIRMQQLLRAYVAAQNASAVFVSHDLDEALLVADEVIVLTRRPARIRSRFSVEFPEPRTRELLTTPEFAEIRRSVIAAFLGLVPE